MESLTKQEVEFSKFLALVLRHKPEAAGLELDKNGWADTDKLIAGFRKTGRQLDEAQLERIVALNNKKRYEFSEDKKKIRARQGHSVDVDVELEEAIPPDVLYHGTARKNLQAITAEGLKPMGRKYVHLSADIETALNVGKRHGDPVVLEIDAKCMKEVGQKFWLSRNGVWLCQEVSPYRLSYAVDENEE